MSVFQNFYCKNESLEKTGNFLIDLLSIVEIGPIGCGSPKYIRLSSGTFYIFDEENYYKLLDAMDRVNILMYDVNGKRIN